VQSYEAADLARSTPAQVVFEDQLAALAEALRQQAAAAAASSGAAACPATAAEAPDPVQEALQRRSFWAVPRFYCPELQSTRLACLDGRMDGAVGCSAATVEIGSCSLDQSLWTAPAVEEVPQDAASDALPEEKWSSEERSPAGHGLTDAEEAALLGGVEPCEAAPFAPAWEVDAFRWPDLCAQLDEASGRKLTQSGVELGVAVRDGLQVIAVTSHGRQEGRTTVALSLARAAATAGCRVALLDADCVKPQLARRLGLDSPCDWQQVRRQYQPLGEAAVASLDDRVTLLPLAVADCGLSGWLDDPTLCDVVRELKQSFDLVIIDAQPVTECGPRVAPSVGAGEVDMVLMVRNVHTTPTDACLAGVARLRETGVRAVGIVENFAAAQ